MDMADEVYFEGDPEIDSRRRHMERVLKGEPSPRRWPWIVALLAGGAWATWRYSRSKNGNGHGGRASETKP
jgi:hypothetical protein